MSSLYSIEFIGQKKEATYLLLSKTIPRTVCLIYERSLMLIGFLADPGSYLCYNSPLLMRSQKWQQKTLILKNQFQI